MSLKKGSSQKSIMSKFKGSGKPRRKKIALEPNKMRKYQ